MYSHYLTPLYLQAMSLTYHFPLFASQYNYPVGLLQPAGVSSGKVVKTSIDVLAHSHDLIKVLLSGYSKLKACLGQGLWEQGHSQAGINLHLETTDEIESEGEIIVDCFVFLSVSEQDVIHAWPKITFSIFLNSQNRP